MMKLEEKLIRVRLAPSPTGPLHIGTARTALFNWLFARQNGGKFILRIEDTDAERSKKEYEAEIFEGLKWLGLEWDEGPFAADAAQNQRLKIKDQNYIGDHGPYRQSERKEIYKKYLTRLLDEEKAYYCYCTKEDLEAERQAMMAQGLPPKYGGHCRSGAPERASPNWAGRNLLVPPAGKKAQVIRFKTPESQVEFKDLIRGKIVFDASLFGDMAIAKNLEAPLFTFAGVVDDSEMKISHVIRGEDHLSNTPKQILIQRALGFEEPEYAHLPLILNLDRSKMSKRFADTALSEYRQQGYLSEAIINFLALLGWHGKDDREIFNLEELVKEFDLRRVQKAGAVFNQEKLDWLQKEHMKNLSTDKIVDFLGPILKDRKITAQKEFLKKVVELERPRLKTFNEFLDLAGFLFELPDYDASLLLWQKEPATKAKMILEKILSIVEGMGEKDFRQKLLSEAIAEFVGKEGRGPVFWPLRVAVSGLRASPDPLEIMEVLSKDESERRIRVAIAKL